MAVKTIDIKICPYAKVYNGVLMCMDYVIPCSLNKDRSRCKYSDVVKGVNYGNADLSRAGLRSQDASKK